MKNIFNNKNIYSDNPTQLHLWFLFCLTIFLTLLPFFKIGLTNCDDIEFYTGSLMGTTAREIYAQGAGRFYFLFTKPFYHIAYLIDNFYFTKVVHYSLLLLSFSLFAIVVKKIFKQTAFALSVFLLLLVFLTVAHNNFIPFQALPVYFTLSFSIFLLSLLSLIKYYETKKYKHLIVSVILAAVALLFYENYLMFILFVTIFMLAKNISEQGKTFLKNKKIYKEILPFAAICIVYVTVYYLYRLHVQTENEFYCGTTIAKNFNFSHFLQFIWNPNKMAFPLYVYSKQQATIQFNSLLLTGHQNNFGYILTHSQPISIVNALIQCFLFCVLFSRIKTNISWKRVGIAALISSVFIFAVNFILAISEKHNALYYQIDGYVTTYYSYFCITLFIVLLAYSCLKLGYQNRYIKASVIAIFGILCFYISIITGYNNDHLSRDWQHSQGRHVMMKKLLKEGIFDDISDDAIIYMDNFNQTSSILGHNIYGLQPDAWVSYIHIKTGRKLNIFYRFESLKNEVQANSPQEVYLITKYEAQKSSDILLVLSKIDVNSVNFEDEETAFDSTTANEAVIYYYSANKNFVFQFTIPQCSPQSTVTIDNTEIQKVSGGINAIRIENTNLKKAITAFTLKSDAPFLVKDFAISNIGFLNEETIYLYNY